MKIQKLLLSMFLCFICIFAFAGCSNNSKANNTDNESSIIDDQKTQNIERNFELDIDSYIVKNYVYQQEETNGIIHGMITSTIYKQVEISISIKNIGTKSLYIFEKDINLLIDNNYYLLGKEIVYENQNILGSEPKVIPKFSVPYRFLPNEELSLSLVGLLPISEENKKAVLIVNINDIETKMEITT